MTKVDKVPIAISPRGTIVEDDPSTVIINAYYIPMAVLYAKCIFPYLMPSYSFVPDILENEGFRLCFFFERKLFLSEAFNSLDFNCLILAY